MAPEVWYLVGAQPEKLQDQTELAVWLERIVYLRPYLEGKFEVYIEPLELLNKFDVWEWTEDCAYCYEFLNLLRQSCEFII